jgi:hypothetical protein
VECVAVDVEFGPLLVRDNHTFWINVAIDLGCGATDQLSNLLVTERWWRFAADRQLGREQRPS